MVGVLEVSPQALVAPDAAKYKAGEIPKDEHNKWRYRYPEFDTTQRWAKVPS